jgi:hypothetical protein
MPRRYFFSLTSIPYSTPLPLMKRHKVRNVSKINMFAENTARNPKIFLFY